MKFVKANDYEIAMKYVRVNDYDYVNREKITSITYDEESNKIYIYTEDGRRHFFADCSGYDEGQIKDCLDACLWAYVRL